MDTLDELIKDANFNVKYNKERLAEWRLRLDAYYTARDAKADKNNQNAGYDISTL